MKRLLIFLLLLTLVACDSGVNDMAQDSDIQGYQDGEKYELLGTYIENFDVETREDAVAYYQKYLLDKLSEEEKEIKILSYFTDEYEGFIELLNDDTYFVIKRNAAFEKVYFFRPNITSYDEKYYNEDGSLKFKTEYSTEADFRNNYYYDGNIVRVESINLDGTTRLKYTDEIVTIGDIVKHLRINYEFKGYIHNFEYSDKVNEILSAYNVIESDGRTYTWYMDGNGNNFENAVSLEYNGNIYHKGEYPLWEGFVTPPGILQR